MPALFSRKLGVLHDIRRDGMGGGGWMDNLIPLIDGRVHDLVEAIVRDLDSVHTRQAYAREITGFITWLDGRPVSRETCSLFRQHQRDAGRGDTSVNLSLSAIRKFAKAAADHGHITLIEAEQICRVPNIKLPGRVSGNWLTKEEAEKLLHSPPCTLKGIRDRAILALLIGCGLRRSEVATLTLEHIQQREGRWTIVDMVGKGNKRRTIAMVSWCKAIIDCWTRTAGIYSGVIVRRCQHGKDGKTVFPERLTTTGIWRAVELYSSASIGRHVAPHDLRRTFAKLARNNGADLEQIQIALGHNSLETTQIYLGTKINFQKSPGDMLGLEIVI